MTIFKNTENNELYLYINHKLIYKRSFDTGESVTIRFVLMQHIERYLAKGRKWWIHEGATVIGYAEMI